MSASAPNQTVFSIGYDFHLGNGDNGNVFGITNYRDQNRNQTFTYDALNRLTSAQNAGTDCSQMTVNGKTEYWGNSYGYDPWGNLLQKTVTKCSAENLSVAALSNNQVVGYNYDAAGNMTHDATTNTNYSFDQENRITGAGGYTYTYDADGNRVEKSNGSTGTIYWYMSPGIVAESDLTGTLKSEYVFFDGERVARKDFSGSTTSVFYYFSDHLKTASVITDCAGTIKVDSDYYPWGGELQFVNNDNNHYKFTGKERDSETGLDYFGARYYANWTGRFLTPDWAAKVAAVPYAEFADPQSLNLYTYVRNVPTVRRDIDGHQRGERPPEQEAREEIEFERDLERGRERIEEEEVRAELNAQENARQDTINRSKNGWDDPISGVCHNGPMSRQDLANLEKEAAEYFTKNPPEMNIIRRVQEIQGTLSPRTQNSTTTAVGSVVSPGGTTSTLVGTSEGTLRPVQRNALQPGEQPANGQPRTHAEINVLNHAKANGQRLTDIAPSRPACANCRQTMQENNVTVHDPK